MLRSATRHQRRKAYYDAIIGFEKVRQLEPSNEPARLALESLEKRRRTLIREYLGKANELVLRQDLAGAVPFFKKVRALDGDNEEAKELQKGNS